MGRTQTAEHRKKNSDWHKGKSTASWTPRGEKSHLWKGGLAFRKKQDMRNDSAYTAWAKEVKKRDKGICRLQNDKCEGYKIVHHILPWRDYPEERYNLQNGITLCQYHHPRKRKDEINLIPILKPMVEQPININ